MRFTYEEKLKMYDLMKNQNNSINSIAKKYNGCYDNIRYMHYLMDRHGVEINLVI